MSAFIRLFADLDRLGPGSAESLRWALGIAGTPSDARVLDGGCGTGADLGTLSAAVPQGQVVAVDQTEAFVARVKKRFPKVLAQVGDMRTPPPGPYDLIWSAGAVYTLGVATALAAWRPHLAPGGCVAFSDVCTRLPDVPPEVEAFFARAGVTLRTAPALLAEVEGAGYAVLGARWVGPAGWATYYGPLESQLDEFDEAPDLVARLRAEIALWRTHGVTYGCRIVVAKPV